MAETTELLLYAARLSASEKEQVLVLDKWFVEAPRFQKLGTAIEDVCLDRLIRATGCLDIARRLSVSSDEEELRAAVGRAYYSIHHAIRAIALWKNKWDPDGHEESIRQLQTLLRDNRFCGESGLQEQDGKGVFEARQNRHVADYSPYDRQRPSENGKGLETITDDDWQQAATYNITLADQLVTAAIRIVAQENIMSLKERLQSLEDMLRRDFSDVKMEITWQIFENHAEFWVYVLELARFEEVRERCRVLERDDIATRRPDIWILSKTWTGPWPGGDSEAEIRKAAELERRREEFRRRHNMVRATAGG